ncbi:methyl-accepting chemotaxis protein [Peribacillus sp. SCS-37]|uniref:methyl-accepting chemotaxis protein n=1 Tax=Paraperibacillus esterisolvens TaxID=3115296 RepID=UPI003906ADD8
MKWFFNLKTSVKLITSFILLAVIVAGLGIYGLTNMNALNEDLNLMYEDKVVPISQLGETETSYQRIRVNIRDLVMVAKTPEKKDEFQKTIREIQKEMEDNIKSYENTYMIEQEKKYIDELKPALNAYYVYLEDAIKLGYQNDVDGYLKMAPDFKAAGDKAQSIIRDLIEYNIELSRKSAEESNAQYSSARLYTIVVIAAAVIFSIVFGYVLSQIISRPLKKVVDLVGDVAQGDLSKTTDINTKDEIGVLAASVNDMIVNLRNTVGNIIQSAESVAASSQEISATTQQIASGATSQAHDAQTITELFTQISKGAEIQSNDSQKMAGLFKELNEVIDSVAKTAQETAIIGEDLAKQSEVGGRVVKTSIDGMTEVSEQMSLLEKEANKIGDIIKVIDDISSQTNLLSLNAAIEAARAGEQGKGFAVVADEVRQLAEKSSEATKEISEIIKGIQNRTQSSVEAVKEGVDNTHKTGEAFSTIAKMVAQSSAKVEEIQTASKAQSAKSMDVMTSIESIASSSAQQSEQASEVMTAVESIAAASEESAAASEQTAATSHSLANLAEELNHSVSIFKVN